MATVGVKGLKPTLELCYHSTSTNVLLHWPWSQVMQHSYDTFQRSWYL